MRFDDDEEMCTKGEAPAPAAAASAEASAFFGGTEVERFEVLLLVCTLA